MTVEVRVSSVPALAVAKARRLLRHPLVLAGFALFVLASVVELRDYWGPRPAFSLLTNGMALWPGVPVFFAAELVASASRRAGGDELLGALPASRTQRTAASCLAALGPFLVACAVQMALCVGYAVQGVSLERFPTVFELALGPLCVLGAGLLGVASARWLPWAGASVLVMVALVFFNVVVNGNEATGGHLFGFYAELAVWGPWPYRAAMGFNPGHTGWHAVYLLALCLGAGALAMLRDSPRRRFWLGAGALTVIAVAVAGLGQLP
ncbi:hypothetical protein GCM10009555_000120 [Acrocarpospora macrocephala]|uniref:Uncharacterized protein n=1 Tax=Acrocarpospora macrocephala TaxID=150177 RepID=A0A5M3WQN5_9ACTN|nr:hypothetical protein [Acrocarpospora macrocephala]GES11605.1 hypothetical protein Amac_052020 [Acrocarpospora macrocephala]